MSLLDNIQSTINKGTTTAERTSKTIKLKMQKSECVKNRQALAAQLGASLFKATKNNADLRKGREQLFDGIEKLDARYEEIDAELKSIEAETALSKEETPTYLCCKCGATVRFSDLFCSGCGTSIDTIKASYKEEDMPNNKTCQQCGASMKSDDLFCINCGAKSPISQEAKGIE